MRKPFFLPSFLFLIACFLFIKKGNGQVQFDKLIQINGVLMTTDSLYGIPDAIVSVKNHNKGTYTSPQGVFAVVCFKGDTLQFRSVGFQPKDYIVPENIVGNTVSMIQLMTQDTFFLNETIIYALPSKERFNYVFQHLDIDDDNYELARKSTNLALLRMLTISRGGAENQAFVQQQAAYKAAYDGQQQPMNILSPIKWGQFIEAWKRGDFRKKKKVN